MLSQSDRLYALRQTLYPKRLLSALMYAATRIRFRPWKNWQIRRFVRTYGVRLDEAVVSDPEDYVHFNAFFTRALKPSSRPLRLHQRQVLSPVDGTVSQVGGINNGCLLQTKGRWYTVASLLGGDDALAQSFSGGCYVTLYLSPRDYHRVHMPCSGVLRNMIHIPGDLFSVCPRTVQTVGGLFARNERVASIFTTVDRPMALVLVGAVFVGGIEQTWHGVVTSPRRRSVQRWNYATNEAARLGQGDEMGRFNMGSTVVLLLGADDITWATPLRPGQPVRMGETIGRLG